VPILIGGRIADLRDRRDDLVFPAQRALHECRSTLTEQLASIRGYQISGDTAVLERFQEAVARAEPAADRLVALTTRLGPEPLEAVEEFQARIALWQQLPRALQGGSVTREELVASLSIGQERFDAALAAAAAADAALTRAEVQLENRIRSGMR